MDNAKSSSADSGAPEQADGKATSSASPRWDVDGIDRRISDYRLKPQDVTAALPVVPMPAEPDRRFYSASGGTAINAGWENPDDIHQGYGYRIRVLGDNGVTFTYGHTDPDSAAVKVGDKVTMGQYLGEYADPTNGRSIGPHSHLEVRNPSQPLQPEYNDCIKNSRAMGAVINPAPYVGTVMPGAVISDKFGMRAMNGKQEVHPGLDMVRRPGRRQ